MLLPLLLALAAPALAQEPSASEAPTAASLARPPTVIEVPEAVYPSAALSSGRAAEVLLRVGLDAAGAVVEVAVLEAAGDGFDEAAVTALRAARFTPALDETGAPVPATLEYRVRFSAQVQATRAIEGSAVLADGSPLAGRTVRARGPEGAEAVATTDGQGRFAWDGLAPGAWTIALVDPVLETALADVEVKPGAVAVVTLRTRFRDAGDSSEAGEVVLITAERLRPEITERRLEAEEIKYLPGSNGDVVKVVQNLPGVARPPLGTGALIIRGAAPEDSAAFLDGARIPVVFHFSGLTTILAGDLLDEVAFVPGNASARYGRFLSGMVELRTTEDPPTEPDGRISVDLYQASAYVEQPLREGGLSLSVRRSYADAVLVPVLNAVPDLSIQAPRYYDAQLRGQGRWRETKLDVLGLFSDDSFALLGSDDEDGPVEIGLSTRFWRGRVRATTPLANGWTHELNLGGGADVQAFQFDVTGEAEERNGVITLRDELSLPIEEGRTVGWRFGLDLEAGPQSFLYDVASFGPREEGEAIRVAPALYVESTVVAGDVRLIPGFRVDALLLDSGYATVTGDPRWSARWAVDGATAVRFGLGRYSQFPTVRQLLPESDGNPDLVPAYAIQASLGLDHRFGEYLSLESTLFYNHLENLVVGREDRLRFFSGPPPGGPLDDGPYANDGVGRVCGGELLLRLDWKDTLALLSVTASNSARVKRPGQDEVLFEYDQPLVLNALASQALPRGFRLGARARYGSGNPSTPVVNRVYDLESRSFIPIYGERDSVRLPAFFALDIRGDKVWEKRWGEIGLYLDVQNATNRQNVELVGYTYDYSEEDPVAGLPIFPTFGLEVKW